MSKQSYHRSMSSCCCLIVRKGIHPVKNVPQLSLNIPVFCVQHHLEKLTKQKNKKLSKLTNHH